MGFKSDNTIRNYEKQRTRDRYGAKKRKLLKEQEDDKSKVKGVVSTTV
jgi:mannose-6-phosphate isomerase class I|tara:strand:+ start:88 stop:231 length:144 start_codon:yes stop_codon:yes gene_type:complete